MLTKSALTPAKSLFHDVDLPVKFWREEDAGTRKTLSVWLLQGERVGKSTEKLSNILIP